MYYLARLMSAQNSTEFTHSHYDDIKKVYSIWLCHDAEGKTVPTITTLNDSGHVYNLITKKNTAAWDSIYYKGILVTLGNTPGSLHVEYIDMLNTIFARDLTFTEKKQLLENVYNLKLTKATEGGLEKMCNLSQGIAQSAWSQGIEQGMASGIKQGIEQGAAYKAKETALNMSKDGLPSSLIAKYIQVSEATVKEWLEASKPLN